MKPLRILLASAAYRPHPSGVAQHVWNLRRKLEQRGHLPHVLTLAYNGTCREPGVTRIARAAVVPANRSRITLSFHPNLRGRVRRYLAAREFDAIHCHGLFPPDLGYWVLENARRPCAVTFHTLGVAIPKPVRNIWRRACRPGWRNIAAPIAVSEAGRRWAETWLERDCRVIPNGVALDEFRPGVPAPAWFPHARPVLLFVGRLDPRKGLAVLLGALPEILTDHPGTKLVVCGTGPEQARCRKLAGRLGVEPAVLFAGRVAFDELAGCYANSTAFVSPALGSEAMGIVLIEALASGTPVVASRIPGYDEVVRDGQDGLLCRPGDPRDLARAVKRVLSETGLRNQLAQSARPRAEAFSWDLVTDKLLQVYEELELE
ncbi:glycosyltransferase family 4 protein [candidate division WOR-3 bacterium]|nr:glycosyltransferase family 4 protein [candidate division WOR-3 bacterium]